MENSRTFRFGAFTLDTTARELYKNGTRIKLRGQPYLILQVLLTRPGQVVTRDEIRETLWRADTFVDFEHGLNTSVKKLRQVLCDSADQPRYIETVPRVGYRFIAPVEAAEPTAAPPVEDRTPASSVEAPTPESEALPAAPPSTKARRLWTGAATLLLFGAIAITGVTVYFRTRSASPSATANLAASQNQFRSIAVLPLENLSDDPGQEYFADGMTDELITDLAQLGSLRVISRTSTMHYKSGNKTVPQIAHELGVDALIEGTVERAGDRVRIRVQLIDAAGDRHLWARSYDRELKDVLLLQSTVARDIASQIQGQVAESQADSRPRSERIVQFDAYEAYLKGRYFLNTRTEQGLQKSIEYFQDAIAKDPSFAQAYAGLAESYCLLGSNVLPAEVAHSKARAAASKAVELDPNLAEGHTQMGLVYFYYDWNWTQAEREFQRALALNPNYASTHHWYSYYLRAMGRLPQALEQAQLAQQLDPVSLFMNTTLAGRYRDLHQYDRALEVNQRALELDPNFIGAHEALAALYREQGNLVLAVSECKKAFELSHNNPSSLANLGYFYAFAGEKAEAHKIADQLVSKQQYVPAWDMAVLFTGLGDADSAFLWLEKSYRDRESQMPFLKVDNRLTPLRTDPRFLDLLHRVGLPL